MLEMLKARKAELEARGKKGFTLMEMLIVIAIIAVLIAIAIPVFTAQLDSANRATTEANGRSVYSLLTTDYMDGDGLQHTGIDGTYAEGSQLSIDGQEYAAKGDYKIKIENTAANATNPPKVSILKGNDATPIATFGQS